jgi:hypothetical protein
VSITRNVSVVPDTVPIESFETIECTNPDEPLLIPYRARTDLVVEDAIDALKMENREELVLG